MKITKISAWLNFSKTLVTTLLHQANANHPGILGVYQDNNLLKNMSFQTVVRAIANLEAAGVPLVNQFISLNQWNY